MTNTTHDTRSFRFVWWITGGIVALIAAVGIGIYGWGLLTTTTETQNQVYRQPITALSIDADAATIVVAAGPAGQVSVHRVLETTKGWKPTISEQWSGSSLHVTVKCPDSVLGRKCSIAYAITVPAATTLAVQSDTGDLTIGDLTARTTVNTSSGTSSPRPV
ncbi:DUF4097 domain-containing protein [Fodinicola feengrottensis]|uniref:DUF4097 domain-containing protein n=1 Tax=Fodinicola feengrottensis TaxID=435914 RepID=UPI0013D25430|nr:DUF4097 domain-containing protein [Fodinicola feengrottensis]